MDHTRPGSPNSGTNNISRVSVSKSLTSIPGLCQTSRQRSTSACRSRVQIAPTCQPTHSQIGFSIRGVASVIVSDSARARVTADYHPEPTLAMWVPSEMREEYADAPRAKVRTFPNRFKGVAQYGKFRRFSVTAEEGKAVPRP